MNQPFILIMFISSFIILCTPSILYLLFFKKVSNQYEIILSPFFTALITLCVLIILNNVASDSKCKKKNTLNSLKQSYKTAIVVFVAYYIIIFFPFFITPILKLTEPIGNGSYNTLFNRLGTGYYLMLLSWSPIIIGYFNTIKYNCKLDKKIVDNYKKDIWKVLNIENNNNELKTVKIT